MGRRRTRIRLTAREQAQLRRLMDSAPDQRQRERLQVALLASTGDHTLEDLAGRTGRARATIQLWLGKFRVGGINELLKRDTPPGLISPLASSSVQSELRAGLRVGRWRSASEVARWLQQTHGITRSRKSIYYWLAKM